ncbi:Probable ATP-dependent helicase dinG homolog [Achromobacter spanius]|uniref:ATP-dependent DNA helicase n=1 Tax=Achromobacter spanius TaxID=217203 RepID=UPI000C2B914E|nr:ATP-dependent DNA helicase [Achromobacter spanius]AUA59454.1 helicase [Achromobacter spanius]CAB3685973.1 3'-5' exonuclease DinG [Achromobacter spanius]SPT40105.1 Probable ATP-dependent helicase dinG homolog [Achromobacter denitrificans]VEE58323.1 Probable ATP-dependent helicase dinG homolog [Achromobacter spanius]
MLDLDISEFFDEDGPLATAMPGYKPRPSQVELSQAIGDAIQDRATLVAEAGTGIGKTWAYLVPAFIQGGKVLISTGTRTLQDQLFARDLPRVRAALAAPVTAALLKGRGNYVCHYHLERLQGDERALKSRTEIQQLRQIQVFAGITKTGDRSDLAQVPEDADIWQRVTSTRENCLGQECPRIRDCFVVKARRQAQEADVVVVNHALFMADLVLREEGVTDLLPEADTVIFDEAHQLPDTATRFLGNSVSTHQLMDFGRALEVAGLAYAREAAKWSDVSRHLETAARELRLACAPLDRMPGRKATFEAIPNPEEFDEALATLREAVDSATKALGAVAEKHPDLMAAARGGAEISVRLKRWATPGRAGTGFEDEGWGRDDQAPEPAPFSASEPASEPSSEATSAPALGDGPSTPAAILEGVAAAAEQWTGPAVRWVEHGQHHVRLHSAPLSVAQAFSKYRKPGQAWIMTSATLSVNGEFTHFTSQLGLERARTGKWESPFNYPEQALLFVPRGMPEPQSPQFLDRFVDTLMPLLEASPGGTLVLCTTLRAVEKVATLLADAFDDAGHDWPLLKQGEGTRRDLLDRFCKLKHPVLVGSASFWEGIDLPGDVLTLVAIDKLPFAPPDDPVIEARLRACRAQGGNPFSEYQLPEAAISLKQGAGRLIRTESDWGVLMVGDARLVEKPYGKRLWRGLPPFARTRELDEVLAFYQRKQGGADV